VLREEVDKTSMFEEVVGTSPVLQAVLARAAKVAPTDSTVLITGETGTGKELIARAIQKRSQRSARAFVSVNCAAIPQSLITSELFGHEKGAFTGATQRRLGRFELAEGGTLFLDEIGELPAETQIALLRVIKLKPLPCAWNSHTKAKGALNNVMDPNIYLNAIVFYRLAQRSQKQKAVPEPEFRQFDLTYSRVRPGSAIIRKTQAGPERRGTIYLTPFRPKCRRTVPSYSTKKLSMHQTDRARKSITLPRRFW